MYLPLLLEAFKAFVAEYIGVSPTFCTKVTLSLIQDFCFYLNPDVRCLLQVIPINIISWFHNYFDFVTDSKLHTHSKTTASFPGLVEFFFLLLLPLRCLVDVRNLRNTVSLLLALFSALFLVRFLKIPVPELIVQATEAKAKAESLVAERAKDLQLLQEKTTDYVTKSKFFRSIRKRHTGNYAVYVTNRKR